MVAAKDPAPVNNTIIYVSPVSVAFSVCLGLEGIALAPRESRRTTCRLEALCAPSGVHNGDMLGVGDPHHFDAINAPEVGHGRQDRAIQA